jgi:hypothetical protein
MNTNSNYHRCRCFKRLSKWSSLIERSAYRHFVDGRIWLQICFRRISANACSRLRYQPWIRVEQTLVFLGHPERLTLHNACRPSVRCAVHRTQRTSLSTPLKTNSIESLQPILASESTPAVVWSVSNHAPPSPNVKTSTCRFVGSIRTYSRNDANVR